MARMSGKEIERQLGLQYAELLKDSPTHGSVYSDCQAVIETSLDLMNHYNRVAVALQNKLPGRRLVGAA